MRKLLVVSFFVLIQLLYTFIAFAEWSEPIRISEPGGCSYPQILAIGDTLHVVYNNGRGGEKISYVRSTDGGESWSQFQVISDTSENIQSRHPWILQYQGRLMVLYFSFGLYGVFDNNIACIFSDNDGLTWESPEYILDHNWERPLPIVASSAESVVNIVMSTAVSDSVYKFNIRSTNFGQSWSAPQYMFNAMQSGSSDMAQSDSLINYCWSGQFNSYSDYEVYYLRSTDAGSNWSENMIISEFDQHQSYSPAICTNGFLDVMLTWKDYKHAPPGFSGDIFLRESIDAGEYWTEIMELTSNHFAVKSDIICERDTLHVVWEDVSAGITRTSIQYARSINNGLTWSEPYSLDNTLDNSQYPTLGVSNDHIYAVWGDTRYSPDTSGLFFTRWQAEPDAVHQDEGHNLTERISIFAYPNPFNASVTISYSSMEGGDVKIINSLGQFLRNFKVDASDQGRLVWDGKDLAGEPVVSGVYFVRFRSGGQTRALKLFCVK